jgi:hypothetical protein
MRVASRPPSVILIPHSGTRISAVRKTHPRTKETAGMLRQPENGFLSMTGDCIVYTPGQAGGSPKRWAALRPSQRATRP